MSQLGEVVYKATEVLAQFHHDVSQLTICVEDALKERQLVQLKDSGSFWYNSYDFRSPRKWMPRTLFRFYRSSREPGSVLRRAAFFFVAFTPKHLHEPTAFWGLIKSAEPIGVLTVTRPILLPENGMTLAATTGPEWSSQDFGGWSVVWRMSPVVDLKEAATVEAIVVDGLTSRFATLPTV